MNQHRQTASYLSKRLAAAGLRPVSRYGQNFLIDLNLIDLIARSAELVKTDVVLEVGTGVGNSNDLNLILLVYAESIERVGRYDGWVVGGWSPRVRRQNRVETRVAGG